MNPSQLQKHTPAGLLVKHLDWSDKQRRILTANCQAESYFHPDRGFEFDESDLPHFLLTNEAIDNRQVFTDWKTKGCKSSLIAGAWTRVLFHGGWEFTSHADEHTYNLQTETLFIDLRIPKTRRDIFSLLADGDKSRPICSVHDLDAQALRYYARQHVFAGFSKLTRHDSKAHYPWSCTRHHVMDWNYVGMPRTRPNKWWIEMKPHADGEAAADAWKEWAFATDSAGQHYYCEQWERRKSLNLRNNNEGDEDKGEVDRPMMLALRMKQNPQNKDGILIVVGNEFNYCLSQRPINSNQDAAHASLVALVDDAVTRGDLDAARQWLGSMQGGHGHVHTSQDNPTHNSWTIDAAIEFWKEGTSLLTPGDVTVSGSSVDDCTIIWNDAAQSEMR
ncbi:hypothetical protein MPSEU_000807000 [Mayamaea pseudoterrestris]|nr:hypothetical protein MPSEU_000807000 [Mayamaea pseudoterrestris]